ncbi:helix-turn-helix transcriptional regulator [Alkalicella caledoniensis]|uniref:Helix-turn-helix transcriptional regulator n=1 Tax=Alkalicella caledoniensis TaxID=2731377 RepID=A0A7G9W9U1_ALKCA|nr:AraC family transcriptional regulator [Alkalicella caledoniensis]QNO15453.1 helix-turn-helix transcriptional regulator [Alkalicella caledoniensis]
MAKNWLSPGRKHIVEIMEKFNLCTHLPIKAVGLNGDELNSCGYSNDVDSLLGQLKVLEKVDLELNKKDSTSSLVLSFSDVNYVVVYICPRNTDRGIYIIGPYATNPGTVFPYKPSDCIGHLITLLRNMAESTDFIKSKKHAPHGFYVKRALDYIDSKYHDSLTVDMVSNKLGISKCYFCFLFKKDTGKTFTQVVNEIRIKKSKVLLLDTDRSIIDIAISVGYNNQNYYSMLFKKLNGITPHQFRNN